MRRLLGLVFAALAATLVFGLSASPALADSTPCTITVTQSITLGADTPCVLSAQRTEGNVVIDLAGHRARGIRIFEPENILAENGTADEIGFGRGPGTLRNLLTGSIFIGKGGDALIDHVRVDGRLAPNGCREGISVAHAVPSITNSVVSHCDEGVTVDLGSASITNSAISNNGAGLTADFGSFYASHNAITHNAVGIGYRIGSCTCTGNNLSYNGTGVLITADAASGTFTNNVIDHSRQYGVLERPAPPSSLFGQPAHTAFNGNHVWWSGARGIQSIPDSTGRGNWVKHSGISPQCVGPVQCRTRGKPKN